MVDVTWKVFKKKAGSGKVSDFHFKHLPPLPRWLLYSDAAALPLPIMQTRALICGERKVALS